jgi:alanine dehydrogenase
LGWKDALRADAHLAEGLNVHAGKLTYKAVADALGYDYTPTSSVLAG